MSRFFILTEYYGTKRIVGGVSVALADRDGRVMGITWNTGFAIGVSEYFKKT